MNSNRMRHMLAYQLFTKKSNKSKFQRIEMSVSVYEVCTPLVHKKVRVQQHDTRMLAGAASSKTIQTDTVVCRTRRCTALGRIQRATQLTQAPIHGRVRKIAFDIVAVASAWLGTGLREAQALTQIRSHLGAAREGSLAPRSGASIGAPPAPPDPGSSPRRSGSRGPGRSDRERSCS